MNAINQSVMTAKPPQYTVSGDEVHIWSAALDSPTAGLLDCLSDDEVQRAKRFYFEKDRNRFVVCHGILRNILGNYLNIEPEQVRFYQGKNGKPSLANGPDKDKLNFNLSHSEGLAIYALTRNREVGVDIEYIRDMPDMEKLAERFFSPRENEVLQILSEGRKKEAFFNCWTRKEAFIKATGDGLSYPLDRFEVSLVPGEPARLISIHRDAGEAARWSIKDLKPAPGYAAAFAVPGRTAKIVCRQWAS